MGKFLRNLLDSMGSVMVLAPDRHYVRRGYSDDAKKMVGDWSRVGNDMRKTLKKHGKSANHRTA